MPKNKFEWVINREEKENVISESEINIKIDNFKNFLALKKDACSDEYPLAGLPKASWSVKIRDHKEKENRLSFTVIIRGLALQNLSTKWSHTALVNGLQIYNYTSDNPNQDRESYSWPHSLALKNAKNDTLDLTLKLEVKLSLCKRRRYDTTPDAAKFDLLKRLSTDSKQFADFTFVCDKKEFKVHKAILAASSPMLSSMFDTGMTEKEAGMCEIKNIDPEIFSALVQFAYTAELPYNFTEIVQKLYEVADYYQMEDLKLRCEEEIEKNLKEENAIDVYIWACLFNDLKDLRATAWAITKNVLKDHIGENLLEGGQPKPEVIKKIKELRDKELEVVKDLKKQ